MRYPHSPVHDAAGRTGPGRLGSQPRDFPRSRRRRTLHEARRTWTPYTGTGFSRLSRAFSQTSRKTSTRQSIHGVAVVVEPSLICNFSFIVTPKRKHSILLLCAIFSTASGEAVEIRIL